MNIRLLQSRSVVISHAVRITTMFFIGTVAFVVIPAGIFSLIEGWTYWEAGYFCFVTILTIGFEDFVPGEFDVLLHVWMGGGGGL